MRQNSRTAALLSTSKWQYSVQIIKNVIKIRDSVVIINLKIWEQILLKIIIIYRRCKYGVSNINIRSTQTNDRSSDGRGQLTNKFGLIQNDIYWQKKRENELRGKHLVTYQNSSSRLDLEIRHQLLLKHIQIYCIEMEGTRRKNYGHKMNLKTNWKKREKQYMKWMHGHAV